MRHHADFIPFTFGRGSGQSLGSGWNKKTYPQESVSITAITSRNKEDPTQRIMQGRGPFTQPHPGAIPQRRNKVFTPDWEEHTNGISFSPYLTASVCLPSHGQPDTHKYTHNAHTLTRGRTEERLKRGGRRRPECVPRGQFLGSGGRVPRVLSGQETSWLPLFSSQRPKVSSGGSATCSPPTALLRSCETRTQALSTLHCLPEPSLCGRGKPSPAQASW